MMSSRPAGIALVLAAAIEVQVANECAHHATHLAVQQQPRRRQQGQGALRQLEHRHQMEAGHGTLR